MRRLLPLLPLLLSACSPLGYCTDEAPPCLFEPWDYACPDGDDRPCATTEAYEQDRAIERFDRSLDGARFVYVIDGLSSPRGTAAGSIGFNLDGLDSGRGSTEADSDCQEFNADLAVSGGRFGIDNALQDLIPSAETLVDPALCDGDPEGCVQRTVDDLIARGELVIVVEVLGVDDLTADLEARVRIHEARYVSGAPRLDASGRAEPDQPVELVRVLGESTQANIFAGRVRARFDAVEIPFPRNGVPLPPPMHHRVELRMDLGDSFADGMLGGGIDVEDLAERSSTPATLDLTRSIVESVADLDPGDDPAVCRRVSFGYALGAVRAEE